MRAWPARAARRHPGSGRGHRAGEDGSGSAPSGRRPACEVGQRAFGSAARIDGSASKTSRRRITPA
jgi:hypothetical protein